MLSTALWSCGTSKSNSKTAYQQQPGQTQHKPDKNQKIPDAANLPVQRELVKQARLWIGTPYIWGGESKSGADCSGFVMTLFKEVAGIALPRNSRAQSNYCISLDKSKIEIGDLIFFSSPKSRGKIAHVGMYIGDNQFIHSSSSRGVIISKLSGKYYVTHFRGVGRVPAIAQAILKEGVENPNPNDKTVIAPKPSIEDKTTIIDIPEPQSHANDTPKPESSNKIIPLPTPPPYPSQKTKSDPGSTVDPETMVTNAFAGRK